jgi:hypothetical protein
VTLYDRPSIESLLASAEWLSARLAVHVCCVPDADMRQAAQRWVDFQEAASPEMVAALCRYWLERNGGEIKAPDFTRWL